MPLRSVAATRYVLPLREGGSLPGLMEGADLGTYVVKFRGAGQGPKALVAEIVVGELARRLGLRVPELVVAEVDPAMAPSEPDQEVQDLLRASAGDNLGMDYLPGSLVVEAKADHDIVDSELAAKILWLDALTLNVDRSTRNTNLLRWHGDLWLIDHGAALYFHHDWSRAGNAASRGYPVAAEHALLSAAGPLGGVDDELAAGVSADVLTEVVALVPDAWLAGEPDGATPDDVRARYVDVLLRRVASREHWLPAVEATRASAV